MTNPLERAVERLIEHTVYTAQYLTELVSAIQQKEAEKTPDDWQAYTVNLVTAGTDAMQLLPANGNRHELNISTMGAEVLLSNTNFDGRAANAMLTGAAAGATSRFYALGTQLTLRTRGGLWGYSTSPTIVTIAETLYKPAALEGHKASAALYGMPCESNDVAARGLR